jgi:hypothetical protein
MIEKGIIHIPQRSELLSISEFALGMKSPPSEVYIKHGTNGHKYWYPSVEKSEMVFDHLDAYWGGSCLEPHDFSSYAMNVKYRMTNFLPQTPYGLTPIIPARTKTDSHFKKIIETDGQFFYDEAGKQYTASEYKPKVETALSEASKRMPVLVRGNIHWSVVRLDPRHIRVTLIDPGYLDPAEREAEIILQHLKGIRCTDILSGESLSIKDGKISVTVPAGIFRIIDIQHQ